MADANLDKRRVNDANPTENLMKNAVFLGLGVDLEAVGRQCARITVLWSLKQCEIRRVRQDIALLHSQLRQPPRTDEPTQHIFESLADFFQHYASVLSVGLTAWRARGQNLWPGPGARSRSRSWQARPVFCHANFRSSGDIPGTETERCATPLHLRTSPTPRLRSPS